MYYFSFFNITTVSIVSIYIFLYTVVYMLYYMYVCCIFANLGGQSSLNAADACLVMFNDTFIYFLTNFTSVRVHFVNILFCYLL